MLSLESIQTASRSVTREMSDHDNANEKSRAAAALPQRTLTVADNQLDSRDLFASAREIVIAHGADRYRLRLTSQNKLILTK